MRKMTFISFMLIGSLLTLSSICSFADEETSVNSSQLAKTITKADYVALLNSSDEKALPDILVRLNNLIIRQPKDDYSQLEPLLLKHLQSTNEKIFEISARVLSLICTETSVKQIHALCKESGKEKQRTLAWMLGEIGSKQSVPVLIPWLQTKDIDLKMSVLLALGKTKSPEAVESLLQVAMQDSSGTCRAYAIRALSEIPDSRSVSSLITLMKQWPVNLEKEPTTTVTDWGKNPDGTTFHRTIEHDPQAYYRQYMIPNVIEPALQRITNHDFANPEAWAKWWDENKNKNKELRQVFCDGFTGYSVHFSKESIPVFISILKDKGLSQYKQENAQRLLSELFGGVNWDTSNFQPMKWASQWEALLKKNREAESKPAAAAQATGRH